MHLFARRYLMKMEVFLNIIIFLVLAMLVAKLLLRYLMPLLLRRFVEKRMKQFGDNFYQQQDGNENNGSGRTFGDIKIDHIPQKDDAKKEQVDEEYVEFEEIGKN